MVHTLPCAATSARSGGGGGGGDVEKYSGVKISERFLRATKWDDMMRGKRYVPIDRLSSIESAEEGSSDAVMIGVLYEKSLPKTGSNGNAYVYWSFTDLSSAKPTVLTLFLHGQAFETWEKDAETPVANGSIVAILNPVPLPSRSSGDGERRAAKVNYGTQIVRLGICPSLGYCTCNKKDGLKCSMPCNRDSGPSVCYYHTMHLAAQKAKQWTRNKDGSLKNQSAGAGSDGIFVLQQPTHRVLQPPTHRVLQPPTRPVPNLSHQQRGGVANASSAAAPRSAPGGAAASPSLSNLRNSANTTGGIDAVTKRLLSCSAPAMSKVGPSRSGSDGLKQQSQFARTPNETSGRPLATPARVNADDLRPNTMATPARVNADDSRPSSASYGTANASSSTDDVRKEHFAAKRVQAQFPNGIPEPDPNNPLKNIYKPMEPPRGVMLTSSAAVGSSSARRLDALLAASSRPAVQSRRAWEQPQPNTIQRTGAAQPVVMSASGALSSRSNFPVAFKQPAASTASKERRRAEKDYGSKIAAQLDLNPRTDLVRKQESRFKSVVDQERVAKRHRDLAELEKQDAMAEKMEAIMEISVQAWRCQQCATTSESHRAKAACEQDGHSLTMVTAKKTRWECKCCHNDAMVLDRALPPSCSRCNGDAWKQGPLRRVAKAPMERDLLMPRGDELPFLNSIAAMTAKFPQQGRTKEATDDYAGL